MAKNERFQRQAVPALSSLRLASGATPALFTYSYAARDLLACAKHLGWTTVLGQIDPGPVEAEVVRAEAARWPEFGAPGDVAPARYWENWRIELDMADHIVVNSTWSKSALVQAGAPEHKLQVVPLPYQEADAHGHAAKRYPAQFTAQRPLRVLFLGQVNHRKGPPALLTALDSLEDLPVELWMVGSVRLNIPERYRRNPRIRWIGPVERSAVNRFYQNADVFVFPTHSDGFGLTQLEAQAWKVPVVASRNCGEVVTHGRNGWLLEKVTPAAIAEALRHCCNHPTQLQQWSEASGIPERFSLSSVGKHVLALV